MKRPLAAFGLCFFIVAFVACQLPRWLLVPLALVFLAGFLTALLLLARRTRISGQRIGVLACFPIFMVAAGLALWYNLGYTEVFVRPVADLAGEERAVVARVEDVEPGYGDDTVHARLAVLEMESGEPVPAFRVVVRGIPDVEIGQIVRMDLQFYAFSGPSVASNSWADGCYIGARAKSAPKVKGESLTFLCRIRILRNNAADNIDDQLPQRLASVAAAMAVGDRRFLSDGTVQNYRMAGLSHLLVVSGLHMSILSGITYLILQRLIRNRYAVSIASISVVVLFMLLTGMTASVVRSGVACMLVYLAGMTAHKADIFTSMALAAVLLGLQNPYSVVDVGLLLSFAATLGAVCGSLWAFRFSQKRRFEDRPRILRTGWQVCTAAAVSVAVTLATLPVLIWAGMGTSLFTLPMNVIAIPLMTPIIVCGLILALPGSIPLIGILLRPASLICGGFLVFFEKLTAFCGGHPEMYIALGGLFALVVVLAVYLLAFLAHKTPYRKTYAFSAAATLAVSLVLHHTLHTATVTITVAGNGANAALVVTEGGQSAVVYRSRLSANGVRNTLQRNYGNNCVLLADLRQNPQSTEYYTLFQPDEVLIVREEIAGQRVLKPMENVTLYFKNQGKGSIACVEVGGYRVALTTGSVDFSAYGEVDVLLAGNGTVEGSYKTLVAGGSLPEWVDEKAEVLYSNGTPQIVIRPGKSVTIREVLDDPFEG